MQQRLQCCLQMPGVSKLGHLPAHPSLPVPLIPAQALAPHCCVCSQSLPGLWHWERGWLGWISALPQAVECPVHFDPWREAWQRQPVLCPSWERALQHPLLPSQGGSVQVRMRPLLWAACSQLLPWRAGLCSPKPAVTAMVTASHHSLRPPALLATSSSAASAPAGFLQALVPGSRAPSCWSSQFNVPPSALLVARPVGVCSMMRLPVQASAEGLDVVFVGVPLDTGTSNRPGARFGPRQIRAESAMVRRYNGSTGAAPFDSLRVADIGDVNVNLYNLPDSCRLIRESYQEIVASGCVPLTLGGDHTITYPILQALAAKHGPLGLVHVDAHTDTGDTALGERIYHGSPFRRCVEERLLDRGRVVQIGIRGSSYDPDPHKYSREQGFRVVPVEECWMKSLEPLMREVRAQMGDKPIYISFDIDGLDPAYAPGTGTPEIAGLTPAQALEIIRGCKGLNIVGCDLVEVAPMYDVSGNTALLGANLLFEMLCVLPGVKTL
ncbi:agmatinase, mitochondrial [Parus major]|uniref:agmatinase, mitochondrial n=1 Tax=Parus major TaxID=9157 RepID=UPI00077159F3|nr:agmatinase, mitochondrial [Parus major]